MRHFRPVRIDSNKHAAPFTTKIELNNPIWDSWPHQLDAAHIDNGARAAHYRVDHSPAIGAIGILEPGVHGAGASGHAVYVAQMDPAHQRIRIEEYNWLPLRYTTRVVPYAYFSEYVHLAHHVG